MPQINSGLKKCNLGIIFLVLGLFILAISLFIPINFFVSMITGLTLMLISLVRFIKNICSECGIVIDDDDIPSCPGCGVDFNWFIWAKSILSLTILLNEMLRSVFFLESIVFEISFASVHSFLCVWSCSGAKFGLITDPDLQQSALNFLFKFQESLCWCWVPSFRHKCFTSI